MSGTWQSISLPNQPANAGTMLLLTDGSVLVHDEPNNSSVSGSNRWYRLIPDNFGNYRTGSWQAVANGPNSPLSFSCSSFVPGVYFLSAAESTVPVPKGH